MAPAYVEVAGSGKVTNRMGARYTRLSAVCLIADILTATPQLGDRYWAAVAGVPTTQDMDAIESRRCIQAEAIPEWLLGTARIEAVYMQPLAKP